MGNPGSQYYTARCRAKGNNEIWRWLVQDLWKAAEDLPVVKAEVADLIMKVKPQLWHLPWSEWDITEALRESTATLKRVKSPQALYNYLQELTNLLEHVHGELLDPLETIERMSYHYERVHTADLRWPVLLSAEGDIMDGRHRIARAAMEGVDTLYVQRFRENPRPIERLRFKTWAAYMNGDYEVLPP